MIIDRIDEEFLLFALRPDGKWAIRDKDSLSYGLAGAWLAELLIEGRIRLDGAKVVSRHPGDVGEAVLDWALSELRSGKRPRRVNRCIGRLGKRAHGHIDAVMRRLEGRGHIQAVVQAAGDRTARRYRLHDLESLGAMRDHLKKVMFGARPSDESSIALLALIDGAGLTGHVFGEHLADQGHLLIERLLRRDARMFAVAKAVRSRKMGWLGR